MLEWAMRRGQIKHLLYEHCLTGRIDKQLLMEQFNDLNNVEPVKHGRWLKNGDRYCECSVCHHEGNISGQDNYCWYCGARMDEVEE